MSTTSSELLSIMSVRLAMIESGVTKPHSTVATATRLLVERLNALAPDEAVQIAYTENPLHAKYIRQSTGEILAELKAPNDIQPFAPADGFAAR
jgi:hypothetical protein